MRREYAVARPVVNTYLIRERDRRRRSELLWVAGTLLPVGLGALLYVWLHAQVLGTGYRIHAMEEALQGLQEQARQLELEAAYLESPGRLETRARVELALGPLRADQMLVAGAVPLVSGSIAEPVREPVGGPLGGSDP